MSDSVKPQLLLLGRPGCHLCEEFRSELETAFPGLAVQEENVDARPDWRGMFGSEIPVLLGAKGEPVCRTQFDAASVQRYLDAKGLA